MATDGKYCKSSLVSRSDVAVGASVYKWHVVDVFRKQISPKRAPHELCVCLILE